MTAPILSICIPTYNRVDWLRACLDSCLPQVESMLEGLVEVVVSDNASPDATPDLLAEYSLRFPFLKVNRNIENNYTQNFDTVIQCARGIYVWLLGDDDALLPGAVAHLVGLIQAHPRDFYLPHVVVDSNNPQERRLEWFDSLPRVDWELTDQGELLNYMLHGKNAAAVFSFMSVLIFLREPWSKIAANRPQAFYQSGWPHVVTALEYIQTHGRLTVIPEALVNYHCSTGAWGEDAWDRAMLDLRGLTRIADHFFADRVDLRQAFLGNLRKNHGDAWIAHHRLSAPNPEAWEESRALLIGAGFDPLKVAAVEFGECLLAMKILPPHGLDSANLVLADLGFMARGARRVLVFAGGASNAFVGQILEGLLSHSKAEILLAGREPEAAPGLPDGPRLAYQRVDLLSLGGDLEYQKDMGERLRAFAPDLLLNLDPDRHPGWDLMAAAAGALAGLAFKAPSRSLEVQVATWLDRHYTRLLPAGGPESILEVLGLHAVSPSSLFSLSARPDATPLKLNLGCGQEHLDGWVNVDQFPGSHPDVVHDLESFPWPFPDGCAEEILLKHVLEHLGRDSATFLKIIQELYRVCAPGARVRIIVPHPRHQDFLQDPTHVRPVLPEMFQHFSLAVNREWTRLGLPGTPLAQYLGLDFSVLSTSLQLDPRWEAPFRSGQLTREQLEKAILDHNNVIQSTEVVLRAEKPFGGVAKAPEARDARLPLVWEGSQFVYHSLAHVNRQLCLGLLASGQVDLSILPYEADQFRGEDFPPFSPLAACVRKPLPAAPAVHVRHQWPPHFEAPESGAWVMIQPWEFGGIPADWVAPMRDQVDEVWVPSSWVKECYVKSGIPEDQVVVVPNGVDPGVFTPEGPRLPLSTRKRVKFLFVGGTIYRKGFDLLLETYRKTFRASDDVCLVIKAQGGGVYGEGDLAGALEEMRRLDPLAPEVECCGENLDEARMAALYRACDVLVLPYRGEGFGLPIAEAMASGLPVIVTGRGAAQDFAREPWAWLIPSTPFGIKTVNQTLPSPAGFWLEEPDPEALSALLRQAFAQDEERRAKGAAARAFAQAHLGWASPVETVLARCRALAQERPRRLRAQVPEAGERKTAFLFEPDWSGAGWVEVLLSYLQAFAPGEPVALVLPWSSEAGPSLESVQERVLELIQRSGWESFPDVVLADRPEELQGTLAGYASVLEVPPGRGQIQGLTGPLGERLARARQALNRT